MTHGIWAFLPHTVAALFMFLTASCFREQVELISGGSNILNAEAGRDTTVSIGDSLVLAGMARNGDGNEITNVSFAWYAKKNGAWAPLGNFSNATLKAPDTAASIILKLEVTDDDGNTASDIVAVFVIEDRPVAEAGEKTIAFAGQRIHLHAGRSRDTYGEIVAYEWDIGNTGTFVSVSGGDTNFVFEGTVPQVVCVLRVTDDDSMVGLDTTLVLLTKFRLITGKADFGPRRYVRVVSFLNKLWMVAGRRASHLGKDVWSSLIGGRWVQSVQSAFPGRQLQSVAVYDNKLWVIGGGYNNNVHNDVWCSFDGVSWMLATPSAAFPPRMSHQSLSFNGKLWVIGGENAQYQCKSDVWHTSDGVNWEMAVDRAGFGRRGRHQAIVFDDKMWVIGGRVNNAFSSDVWCSSDGAQWVNKTHSAGFGNREWFGLGASDSHIWLVGGERATGTVASGEYYNDVWRSGDGITWERLISRAAFSGRKEHGVVVHNRKLFVIAGMEKGAFPDCIRRDVWALKLP